LIGEKLNPSTAEGENSCRTVRCGCDGWEVGNGGDCHGKARGYEQGDEGPLQLNKKEIGVA